MIMNYDFDDLSILNEALTMVGEEPIVEISSAPQSWSVMFGPKMKELKAAIREGKKAHRAGDISTARKCYDKADKLLDDVTKQASLIDDDTFLDWIVKIFIIPVYALVGLTVISGSFKSSSRHLVMRKLDDIHTAIRRLKAAL